jgi:hypothetical protein
VHAIGMNAQFTERARGRVGVASGLPVDRMDRPIRRTCLIRQGKPAAIVDMAAN